MKDLSNENIVHIKDGDIEYLQFRKLLEYKDKVKHCYTTRSDDYEVDNGVNYKKLCQSLNLDYNKLVKIKEQIHSNYVQIINSEEEKPDKVDEDVKDIFEKTFSYMNINDKIIEKGKVKEGKQKYFIDTNLINRTMLEEIGLLKENIIESNICTVCNKDVLHSYRVDRANAGRNTAIISLI